jgi:hypothetical protein
MDRWVGDLQRSAFELIGPLRRLRDLLGRQHKAEDIARRIRILSMGSTGRAWPFPGAVHGAVVATQAFDQASSL